MNKQKIFTVTSFLSPGIMNFWNYQIKESCFSSCSFQDYNKAKDFMYKEANKLYKDYITGCDNEICNPEKQCEECEKERCFFDKHDKYIYFGEYSGCPLGEARYGFIKIEETYLHK